MAQVSEMLLVTLIEIEKLTSAFSGLHLWSYLSIVGIVTLKSLCAINTAMGKSAKMSIKEVVKSVFIFFFQIEV